ncbi:MAG: hypothetical protein ABSB49_09815 [Polyangia bacterium]|jgi:hypothetical protein
MDTRSIRSRIDALAGRVPAKPMRGELVGYERADYSGQPDGVLAGGGPLFRYSTKHEPAAVRARIAALPSEGVRRIVFHFIGADEIAERAAEREAACGASGRN